jgi:hypothetical protein
MSSLRSEGNEFFCLDCGARVRINDTGFFEPAGNDGELPETILAWSKKQLDYIKGFDFSGFTDKPVFCDTNITFSKAERARKENILGTGEIALYADRLRVCGHDFPVAETTTAIIGVRKMSVYYKDEVYAVAAPSRTNLVKYMICGYHLRNTALEIKEEYYGY